MDRWRRAETGKFSRKGPGEVRASMGETKRVYTVVVIILINRYIHVCVENDNVSTICYQLTSDILKVNL